MPGIRYLTEILKTQTKGKKEKRVPRVATKLPSQHNSLWDHLTEGRLPETGPWGGRGPLAAQKLLL